MMFQRHYCFKFPLTLANWKRTTQLLLYFNEDKRTFVAFVLRTAKRRRWKFPFKSKFTIFQSSSRLFQLTLSNVSDLSWSSVPKNHIQVEKERKFRPRLFASSIIHVLACESIRFLAITARLHATCLISHTCISPRKHPFPRRRGRFAKRPHRRRARRNGCFRRLIHVCEIRHVAVVQWRHKMHNSFIFCSPFLLLELRPLHMNPEIFKILYFVTWIRNHFGEGSQKDAVSASGFTGFICTERWLSSVRKIWGFS